MPFVSYPYLTAMARTFNTNLNGSNETGILLSYSWVLEENISAFHCWVMLAMALGVQELILLKCAYYPKQSTDLT